MKKKVLVIASHPDDEILGCGGTIKKLTNSGHEVITVLTTKGRKEEEQRIKKFTSLANLQIGIQEVICFDFPNLKLETFSLDTITRKVEALIAKFDPDIIFTHHYGDLNRDHQVTFQAVLTATRPLPGHKPIEIFCFETVSSSEWTQYTSDKTYKPNYFVNITDTIDEKLKALRYYAVEMRPFPHPRSYEGIKYLAHVRGMTVGVDYAEAFEMIRKVWK